MDGKAHVAVELPKTAKYPLIFLILTAAVSATGSDRVETALERQVAIGQAVVDAADADLSLIDQSLLGMHRALGAGGPNVAQAVDAAFEPLRRKHPDPRVTYTGERDRCRVLEATLDLRWAANDRKRKALRFIERALDRHALYSSLRANHTFAAMKNEPMSEADIQDAFMTVINSPENSSLDVSELDLVPTASKDECSSKP
ncbi:MAG: hypothetical protein M3Q08_06900 [Pseudomonadota bacterium]|nr:hypothetical protein [Pseudomonadota bacterium]